MTFSIVLFIAAMIQFVLDISISKTDEKISDTDGIIPYRWFWGIAIFFGILLEVFAKEPPIKYIWLGVLLTLVFGVRSIFEWKYIRSSQKHISSVYMMALCVLRVNLTKTAQ